MRTLYSRYLFWRVMCPSGPVVFRFIDHSGPYRSKAIVSDADAAFLRSRFPNDVK